LTNYIWEFWEQLLPMNAKIASGFVHAYQIAAEVIMANGDNSFLGVVG
jgi:hypothetical protein